MKTSTLFLFLILFSISASFAQTAEVGFHYQPNKFRLTNAAERSVGSDYSEVSPTLNGSNCVGFFFNKLLNKQNGLQIDLDFMNQKQNYNYASLSKNTSTIYTRLNTLNLGVSHNLYLWDYENDDNIYFTYGVSARFLMNYTDYYNVEVETKVNGVTQTDGKTTIIENDKLITTVTHNDSIDIFGLEAKTADPRYNSINVGADFGLNFLHYFSDNFAFTVGAKAIVYFMDPENKSSAFWSTTSKYKYGNIATTDKREASKMSSFGLSLSLIYCIGR